MSFCVSKPAVVTPPPDVIPPPVPIPDIEKGLLFERLIDRYIYVWTSSGNHFWMVPVKVNAIFVSGYIWNGHTWHTSRVALKNVKSLF